MAVQAFAGNASHTIDQKGRASLPSMYREALGENFTVGLNSECTALALYPQSEWQKIEADLARIPSIDKLGMKYKRSILANSFPDTQLDSAGRVLLPASLKAQVGVDTKIRFVGCGEILEVWAEERYEQEMSGAQTDRDELLAYVMSSYYSSAH